MPSLIVVVGSAAPGREYDPPLTDEAAIPAACRELGRSLAAASHHLVVFSGSNKYSEKDVVEGYLDGGGQSVVVRCPQDRTRDNVAGFGNDRVRVEPDPAGLWEASYYRSIAEADGVVIIGGGRSSRIAGMMAVAQRTPVVALAMFGGGAKFVWDQLARHRDLVGQDDLHVMGRPWTEGSARSLVASLRTKAAKSRRNRVDPGAVSSGVGVLFLLLAAAAVFVVQITKQPNVAVAGVLVGPIVGAVAGGLLRGVPHRLGELAWTAFRAMGAGLVTTMLYVASQRLVTDEAISLAAAQRLVWLVVPIGITAGFTLDLVFARMRTTELPTAPPPIS